mgnify:CR=1 FL=1
MRRMPAQIGKLTAPRFPQVQHPRAQTLRLTPKSSEGQQVPASGAVRGFGTCSRM